MSITKLFVHKSNPTKVYYQGEIFNDGVELKKYLNKEKFLFFIQNQYEVLRKFSSFCVLPEELDNENRGRTQMIWYTDSTDGPFLNGRYHSAYQYDIRIAFKVVEIENQKNVIQRFQQVIELVYDNFQRDLLPELPNDFIDIPKNIYEQFEQGKDYHIMGLYFRKPYPDHKEKPLKIELTSCMTQSGKKYMIYEISYFNSWKKGYVFPTPTICYTDYDWYK